MRQIGHKLHKICTCILFFILMWSASVQSIHATEADVHFGSAWYEPSYSEDFPIGLYIDSTEKIGAYEIIVVYDSHFLSFKGDAVLMEEGKICISGDLQGNSTKIMLNFQAISAGNSTVSVESAVIHSADGSREFDVRTLPSAPIKMKSNVELPYTEMTVNSKIIEDFEPNVTEYEVELDFAETYEVEIKEAETVTVEENVIDETTRLLQISAEDSTGMRTTYLLTVHMINVPETLEEELSETKPAGAPEKTEESAINEKNVVKAVENISEEELKKKIETNRREDMMKAGFLLGLLIVAMIAFVTLPFVISSQSDKIRKRNN